MPVVGKRITLSCAVVLLGAGVVAKLAAAADRGAERAKRTSPRPTIEREDTPDGQKRTAADELLVFGSPPEQFWLVQHGDVLSIWCDHMPANKLLEELRAIGGPSFSSKQPLSRPVTLSFHRAPLEDVLRKMLEGFNFAYYYEDGRLVHVKVLEMIPGRNYKVASPVESRSEWTRRVLAQSDE